MSGFMRRRPGWFELTPTRAEYWHRFRSECECETAFDVIIHAKNAGFTVEDCGSFWRVTGPGLVAGSTDELYRAISGLTSQSQI